MKRRLYAFALFCSMIGLTACGTDPIVVQPTIGTINSQSDDLNTTADLVILADRLSGYETELDPTPDFLRWCVETTQRPDLIRTMLDGIAASGYTDADFYSYTGMTVRAANDLYTNAAETQSNLHVRDSNGSAGISFTFGGDISLADNWHTMQHYAMTDGIADCISPFLIEKMRAADLSSLNNEFCFSSRGTAMEGKQYTFRGKPENAKIYHELGIDIVNLANNHVFDFGADAFVDTLLTLQSENIQHMGAGRNLAEAMEPVYYIIEGKKIAFVAATRAEKYILTPEAGENTPGVLRCYEPERFLEMIREAEANADFVIANVHWGTENSHTLEPVQTETAYQYIDAGADLIIGSHAHCLQGIEFYKDVPIIYNLGNFWFSHYDIDTGLLEVTLQEDDALELVFYPAVQRNTETTYVGGEADGERILEAMRSYSPNVSIDENGVIMQK